MLVCSLGVFCWVLDVQLIVVSWGELWGCLSLHDVSTPSSSEFFYWVSCSYSKEKILGKQQASDMGRILHLPLHIHFSSFFYSNLSPETWPLWPLTPVSYCPLTLLGVANGWHHQVIGRWKKRALGVYVSSVPVRQWFVSGSIPH